MESLARAEQFQNGIFKSLEGLKDIDIDNNSCFGCLLPLGPPPCAILNIPPPPIPDFMINVVEGLNNKTSGGPCPLLCDWTTGQGVELKELHQKGTSEREPWMLYLMLFFCMVLIGLGVTYYFRKIRQDWTIRTIKRRAYNDCTYESIRYPSNEDNRILWATLSPTGKPHHVATASTPPPLPPRAYDDTEFSDDSYRRRPLVSFPVRIENPNIPPLNYFPALRREYPPLL